MRTQMTGRFSLLAPAMAFSTLRPPTVHHHSNLMCADMLFAASRSGHSECQNLEADKGCAPVTEQVPGDLRASEHAFSKAVSVQRSQRARTGVGHNNARHAPLASVTVCCISCVKLIRRAAHAQGRLLDQLVQEHEVEVACRNETLHCLRKQHKNAHRPSQCLEARC